MIYRVFNCTIPGGCCLGFLIHQPYNAGPGDASPAGWSPQKVVKSE